MAKPKNCEECEMDVEDMLPVQMASQERSNKIWIGPINDQTASNFVKRVLDINSQDSSKPIVVYIDSDGGSVYALNSMLTAMASVQNSFITVAMGRAMSAGADLLAAGDLRFISPLSTIMIHETSAGAGGHIEDLNNSLAGINALNNLSMTLLARNMGKTLLELKNLFKNRGRDLYLSPGEAVGLGLADHVGMPAIRERPIHDVEYEISLANIQKVSTMRGVVAPKVSKAKVKKVKSKVNSNKTRKTKKAIKK